MPHNPPRSLRPIAGVIAATLLTITFSSATDPKNKKPATPDCSDLKAEIAKAEKDLGTIRNAVRSLKAQLAEANKERELLAAKLATAGKHGADSAKQLADLRRSHDADIRKLKQTLASLEAEHRKTSEAASAAVAQRDKFAKENRSLSSELEAAWGRAKKAEAKTKELGAAEKEKLALAAALKSVQEDARRELAALRATLDAEIAKRDQSLEKRAAELKQLQFEIVRTRQTLEKAKSAPRAAADSAKLKAEVTQQKKLIESLRLELAEATRRLAAEGRPEAEWEDALAGLKDRIAELERQRGHTHRPASPAPHAEPALPEDDLVAVLHFAKGSCVNRRDREPAIARVKAILRRFPEAQFDIVGHTCSTGYAWRNRCLSKCRAQAVHDLLVVAGVKPRILESYGLGEEEPVADNSTERGRRANRRVEIRIYRPGGLPPGY